MHHVVDDIVVVKHPAGTVRDDLAVRVKIAASDPVRALFAAPLSPVPAVAPDGRLVTLEPRTVGLEPDEPVPWHEAGALLGSLHRTPIRHDPPPHIGRVRLVEVVQQAAELKPGGTTDILRELGLTLLDTWPERTWRTLVHGAWDLNRLGRMPGTTTWLLTDPSTLGAGDPAWDLGAPAGFWAAGLLDDHSWRAFLDGYAEAGGPLPSSGQPWEALEFPARCAVFMATVRELRRSGDHVTERGSVLITACVKINGRRW